MPVSHVVDDNLFPVSCQFKEKPTSLLLYFQSPFSMSLGLMSLGEFKKWSCWCVNSILTSVGLLRSGQKASGMGQWPTK